MAARTTCGETTPKAQLASIIKTARDIMRKDAGLNGDLDRLPQLSWLLFLRAFDERVEQVGPALDRGYRPAIEEPYRWQDWADAPDFSGPELIDFVNLKLLPHLRSLANGSENDPRNVISTVFKDIHNRMLSGVLLRDLVNEVNKIHFASNEDIHTMAFLYESILKEMRDSAGDSGEFYTPRPVIKFMVQQSFLKLGESILDPACGTGGFLVEAYETLHHEVERAIHREQLHNNLRGIEKKSLPYLLCMMNLLLHGVDQPRVVHDNALVRMRGESNPTRQVNVVLTNPPFGGEEEDSVAKLFPQGYQTQETAWLFVRAILDKIKPGGRCAIVLPNGSLFGGGVGARIKDRLMRDCDLHTIVRLPQGVFAPYTQIPANLLFFSRTGPTKQTWFYQIPLPEGRRGYTKTKPMQFDEFDECVKWWGGETRQGREENESAWRVSIADIKASSYNLDLSNPHVSDDLAHRPPQELIAEMIKTEREMLDLLSELQKELEIKK